VAIALVILALLLLGTLLIVRHEIGSSPNGPTSTAEAFNPAPTSVVAAVTAVAPAVVDAVGATSAPGPTTVPTSTGDGTLWKGSSHGVSGLPVVFFYGAEFSPYSAAERWPLVVALSRFGAFGANSLGLASSSGTVAFSDTPSFTFSRLVYTSTLVDLRSVERYSSLNPTGVQYMALQTLSPDQADAVAAYDPSGITFPLLDIANRYVLLGASFSPSVIDGLSQAQIAADLAVPTSPVTESIVAAANEITAAICAVSSDRPATVCDARGVAAAAAKMGISPAG